MTVNLTLSLGTLEILRITASAIWTNSQGGFPMDRYRTLALSSRQLVMALVAPGGGATRLAARRGLVDWATGCTEITTRLIILPCGLQDLLKPLCRGSTVTYAL